MASFTRPDEFTRIARSLMAECHRLGITVPAFRAPTHSGSPRAIRRCPDGVVVSVKLDRDPHAVTCDLVDGCIAANPGLDREAIEMVRGVLWEAAGFALLPAAAGL